MKPCPNDRCTRLHPDEYLGSCDMCGAPAGRGAKPQMSPNDHLNQLRYQASQSPATVPRGGMDVRQPPQMMEIAGAAVDHALFDFIEEVEGKR